jgi:hypothetical protein
MTIRTREPREALRRVLENAVILIFASLLVMSVAMARYDGALLWGGALMVFFAHACEGRARRGPQDAAAVSSPTTPPARRYDTLRWVGLILACAGAAGFAV